MLEAARAAGVKSFTYAASSSTYGDHPDLPKVEDRIGRPLSPYAVTKFTNELYADVFSRVYGFQTVGLRYFNVFGKRQDPHGAYAAVIPLWTAALIRGDDVPINGDGETSRDFCFVDNAVKANILAATSSPEARNQVYNVAVGDRTTLNELYDGLKRALVAHGVDSDKQPVYRDFRLGDIRHSQASVEKAETLLGYMQLVRIADGLLEAMHPQRSRHTCNNRIVNVRRAHRASRARRHETGVSMNKPKVVLFANTDWYLYNFRLSLANKLRDAGFEVILLSPDGEYGPKLQSLGFRWQAVPMNRRSLNPLRELGIIVWLSRFLARERPALVHGFTIKNAVYGSFAGKLANVPARVNAVAGMGYVFTSRDIKARVLTDRAPRDAACAGRRMRCAHFAESR